MLERDGAPWTFGGRLADGEQVLWLGRPDPTRHFARGDVLRIPLSVLWAALVVGVAFSAVEGGAPYLKLLCVPFVLLGIYAIVGRFVWEARIKRRTTYAITNRRVIVSVDRSSSRTRTIRLKKLPGVFPTERTDGSGDIVFGTLTFPQWVRSVTRLRLFTNRRALIGFYDLTDVREPLSVLQSFRSEDVATLLRR